MSDQEEEDYAYLRKSLRDGTAVWSASELLPVIESLLARAEIAEHALEQSGVQRRKAERERDDARALAEEACDRYNRTLVLRCAWCGEAYEDGTPASRHELLYAHAEVCEKNQPRIERDRLRAENEEMLTSRDKERERLLVENWALRADFDKYADHAADCSFLIERCDCGLDAARARWSKTPDAPSGAGEKA